MIRADPAAAVATRRYVEQDVGFPLRRIVLEGADDDELARISRGLAIGLSGAEMRRVQDHFQGLGRHPTDVELEALGQAWSEHCCYKSSKPVLRRHVYGVAEGKVALREDAGLVEFADDHYYAVKMESHNHPSAIEPYGGAATGIGGVLRDVVCMGAQPIALLDPLFFGPLDLPVSDVPGGSKHPLFLLQGVVAGIRDYGNRVGVPTVGGMVRFHPGYATNPLVNVACLGIVRKDRVMRSRVGGVGDVLVYAGGATGRDGIHGVTFASAELAAETEETSRSAVQVGDPILKEPLIHACLEVVDAGLATGLKDFGGGGLSCVVSEMAHAAGVGAEVDLERVPLKQTGMAPWEVWVSESQERMLFSVRPERVDDVLHIFKKWDVPATTIGTVIDETVVRVRNLGHVVLELDLEFQTGGPEYERPMAAAPAAASRPADFDAPADLSATLLELLGDLNIASMEWIIRQYDHEVRGATVLKPLQGMIGHASPGDASVLKPLPGSYRGIALTTDVNPAYTSIDPYWGAAAAVDEAVRNLASVGATASSLVDCLNFGNPEDPAIMRQLEAAASGLSFMARGLDLPFASGNVSLYNEGSEGAVPPTPTILGVGLVDDVRRCVTSDFKSEGGSVYLLGAATRDELGGSAYLSSLGRLGIGVAPRPEPKMTAACAQGVVELAQAGTVRSMHDVSDGGIAVAACEMGFGGNLGATVALDSETAALRPDVALFSESPTRWLAEVAPDQLISFENQADKAGLSHRRVGLVGGDRFSFTVNGKPIARLDLAAARAAWSGALGAYVG